MEVTNPNENWNQPQAPQQENKKIYKHTFPERISKNDYFK